MSEERQLRLDSAAGRHIDNSQQSEVTRYDHQMVGVMEDRFRGWTKRADVSPQYNCHGLTLASRRTWIYDAPTIEQVIADDRYEEIPESGVLPGDLVLYYAEDGDIEHSAIVVEPPEANNVSIPTVLSKWGRGREYLHPANQCNYTFAYAKYFRITNR